MTSTLATKNTGLVLLIIRVKQADGYKAEYERLMAQQKSILLAAGYDMDNLDLTFTPEQDAHMETLISELAAQAGAAWEAYWAAEDGVIDITRNELLRRPGLVSAADTNKLFDAALEGGDERLKILELARELVNA